MEQVEQVFFNVPLSKLEPIFKRWIKEALTEIQSIKVEPIEQPKEFLTIQEAAELLNITVPRMHRIAAIVGFPVSPYFSRTELLEYEKARRTRTLLPR